MKTLVETITAGTIDELIHALTMAKQDYGVMLELESIEVEIKVIEEILTDGSKAFNLEINS